MHTLKVISTVTLATLVGVGAALAAPQDLIKKPGGDRPDLGKKPGVIYCIKAPCPQPGKPPRPQPPVIYCIKAPCPQPGKPHHGNDRPGRNHFDGKKSAL